MRGRCPGRIPSSPTAPGMVTDWTCVSTFAPSGVTTERRIGYISLAAATTSSMVPFM